jgi:hypothetical protein
MFINLNRLKIMFVSFGLVGAAAVTDVRQVLADGPPPRPPAAYDACQSKKASDACSVRIRDFDVPGVCTPDASDGRLFCRPNMPPLPPEAFTACEGKKVSDACTVQLHGRSMNGTCVQTPDSRLFCAPPRPAP